MKFDSYSCDACGKWSYEDADPRNWTHLDINGYHEPWHGNARRGLTKHVDLCCDCAGKLFAPLFNAVSK